VVAAASHVRHVGAQAVTRPGQAVSWLRLRGRSRSLRRSRDVGLAVRRSVWRTREGQPIAKRRLRSPTAPRSLRRARAESMPPALRHAYETRRFRRARSPRRSGVRKGPRPDRSTSEVQPEDPRRACRVRGENARVRSADRLDPMCRRGEAPRSPRPTGSSRSRRRPSPSQLGLDSHRTPRRQPNSDWRRTAASSPRELRARRSCFQLVGARRQVLDHRGLSRTDCAKADQRGALGCAIDVA
jgi:hypothetical protein